MGRSTVGAALAALLPLLACQRAEPCDDEELGRGIARVEEVRAAHPQRIGRPSSGASAFGEDFAANAIRGGCPRLPLFAMRDLLLIEEPDWEEVRERRRAMLRPACPSIDAALLSRYGARRSGSGRLAAERELYDDCELARYGLVDPVRFQLGYDSLDLVATYDHMLRQQGDPTLAATLVRELMWQSPWSFTDEMLATLPVMERIDGEPDGLAVRVGPDGLQLDDGSDHIPLAALPDVATELGALRERWPDDEEPPLLIVADAGTPFTTIVELIDAARANGFVEVGGAVLDRNTGIQAVPLVVTPPREHGWDRELCVDATQTWTTTDRIAPSLFAVPRRPAHWERILSDAAPLPGDGTQVARIDVVEGTPYTRVLEALAQQDRGRIDELAPFSVGRIAIRRGVADCASWHAQLEALRAAAAELDEALYACEREDPRWTRLERCRRRLCPAVHEHFARLAALVEPDPGSLDADAFCPMP